MKIKEMEKLLKINDEWKKIFKGDLLDNLLEKYTDIEEFINLITNEWMHIWINTTSNKKIRDLFDTFNNRIKDLNLTTLKSEYKIIYEIYKYYKELENDNNSINNIKDIIKWFNNIDIDIEIDTIEKLKDKLEDEIK